MATILFNLNLEPLYTAIAQVESDNGATSPNVYQIDETSTIYTDDVNRILRLTTPVEGRAYRPFAYQAHLNRQVAEKMMEIYWRYYGERYSSTTRKPVTYEVLARIHNGGPEGWHKAATVGYWKRVKRELVKLGWMGGE